MILGSCLAVIIPLLIAGTIIYIQLSSSLIERTRDKAAGSARDIAYFIDNYLSQEIKLLSAIAASPTTVEAVKTGDYRFAQRMLYSVHDRIGNQFFTIFILDKNGIARADAFYRQQIGLDLSDREYFRNARKGRESIAGPMFARGKATPEAPILVISVPITDNGVFWGTICIGFNTDFITKILARHDIGQTGSAFLINSEGLVLLHPQKDYILNLNLFEQPGTEAIKGLVQSGANGTATFRFNGVEKIASLARVDPTGWIAVFAQDRDEVMIPVKRILLSIAVSGLVFLFLTIAAIVVFSGKISSPIDKRMELMRQVTKHSNEIIVQIGIDRKIVFVNPAYEKMAGVNAKQVIGKEALFDPVDNPATPIWKMLEAGTPWSGRITVPQNGENATLEVILFPLRNSRGEIQGYLEIGRDITAELMFEKRMRQSQKMEAVGTLAGGVAHDFNNILAAIFGYAELCLMDIDSTPQVEKHIREILVASDRARELVSQILAFSRKADIELRPLSPKTVLKEALKLLRAAIPATIDIQTKLDSDSAILADPTQFHQVIMNLFTNAVHAIGENKGTITVVLEDLVVDEEFIATHPNIKPGNHVIIKISDNGSGMGQDVLDHIFEPFYTTKPLGEGTGLGLSVVHGIVKSFKGIITAYSKEGEGSSFNIVLPCGKADAEKAHQKAPSLIEGDEKIAFIDDEEPIVSAMRAILSNLGYTVTGFTDSENALRVIVENPEKFDIIVADYSMPKFTGLELAEKLKEAGIHIPIIMTSGYFGEHVEKKAQNVGISSLISKPINTYKITRAIHSLRKKENNLA